MWPFRRRHNRESGPRDSESTTKILTVLTPDQQCSIGGIPSEAIAGVIEGWAPGRPISPDAFRANPAFSAFMQQVIESLARTDELLQAEARRQGTGSVGIIDLRTPDGPMGRVPLEDIVGIFAVENGQLGTYHPNDKHVVFSANGLVRLPPTLHALHVRELMRLEVA